MQTMDIYTNGQIYLDGTDTHLAVRQDTDGTRVSVYNAGTIVVMPHPRYALSTDAPASGVPGRSAFEADIRAVLAATNE